MTSLDAPVTVAAVLVVLRPCLATRPRSAARTHVRAGPRERAAPFCAPEKCRWV